MALKHRENIVNSFTLPVGAAALLLGSAVKLSSSLLIDTTDSSALAFITTEPADANATNIAVAGVGSIVRARAHDSAITEGEALCAAAAGRVDGAATFTSGTQRILGFALQASSVQDGLISILYVPFIATDAAS